MTDCQTVIAPHRVGEYLFKGTIGAGAFSIVKLVTSELSGKYFACKIIPKAKIDAGILKRFELEIRIHQQIHHPGVVSLVDVFKDDFNYYIIMEFCPNGELFDYIVSHSRLSEMECVPLFWQLLQTLQFIHSVGVCHRDLKPENILIDRMGHLRISDFGLSRFVPENGIVNTSCGSPCYASPECISGEPYDGRKSDIWSMGIIFFAMVTGQLPWTKRTQSGLYSQITVGDYKIPNFLSPDVGDLITKMMTVDVNKRATIPQLLEHPFFSNLKNKNPFHQMTVPLVSLRKIDLFFDREVNISDFPDPKMLLFESHTDVNYSKIVDHIKDKNPAMKLRKRKIINAQNGQVTSQRVMRPQMIISDEKKQEALAELQEIMGRGRQKNTSSFVSKHGNFSARKPNAKSSLVKQPVKTLPVKPVFGRPAPHVLKSSRPG